MTKNNEQIIIDGVDVSECMRRNDFKLASYDCYLDGGCQCKDNPSCYYKQLKRKEQECEELKYANDCILTTLNVIAEGNKQLRQTLAEIKEILEKCCINQATSDCEDFKNCEECGRISDGEGIQQILQKINEVIDEHN